MRKIIGHLRQIIGCFSGLAAHLKLGSFFIISVSDPKKIHAQSSSFAMLSHMVVNWTFGHSLEKQIETNVDARIR